MEFGALVCLPKKPHCTECPLAIECRALKGGEVAILPVKENKNRPRKRFINYLFVVFKDKTYLNKRSNNDIWHSLYEFPLIETASATTPEELILTKEWKEIFGNSLTKPKMAPKKYKHQLTHQIIFCNFYYVEITDDLKLEEKQYLPVTFDKLKIYAVPRLIDKYLTDLKQEGLLCN